eukprot:COSAG06_NODE_28540_length_572_cov_1.186047_2_plen_40_part_01
MHASSNLPARCLSIYSYSEVKCQLDYLRISLSRSEEEAAA